MLSHNITKIPVIHNLLARTVVMLSASDITRSLHWLPIRQHIYFKKGFLLSEWYASAGKVNFGVFADD